MAKGKGKRNRSMPPKLPHNEGYAGSIQATSENHEHEGSEHAKSEVQAMGEPPCYQVPDPINGREEAMFSQGQLAPPPQHYQQPAFQADLEEEIRRLRKERQTLEAEKYVHEGELRELRKMKEDFQRLQTEKLSSVDNFQPEFDETIIQKFKMLESSVKSVARFISKLKTQLGPAEWKSALAPHLWSAPNTVVDMIDFQDENLRPKLLKSMTWKFLQGYLLRSPFLCYGVQLGERFDGLFTSLFPEPREFPESVQWRSLTVARLNSFERSQDEVDLTEFLIEQFKILLEQLGYEAAEKDLRRKLAQPLDRAIKLAKLVANQRAIIQLYEPEFSKYLERQKKEDDSWMTNVDSTEGDDHEIAGDVATPITPALLKYGNGMGAHLRAKPTVLVKSLVILMG